MRQLYSRPQPKEAIRSHGGCCNGDGYNFIAYSVADVGLEALL